MGTAFQTRGRKKHSVLLNNQGNLFRGRGRGGGECHLNTLDICMKLFKGLKKTTVDILYGLSFVTWPHISSKLARLYIYLKTD